MNAVHNEDGQHPKETCIHCLRTEVERLNRLIHQDSETHDQEMAETLSDHNECVEKLEAENSVLKALIVKVDKLLEAPEIAVGGGVEGSVLVVPNDMAMEIRAVAEKAR